jgi:hypothetical protein
MIGRSETTESVKLNFAINRVLDDMDTYGPDAPEYPALLASLERLTELRTTSRSARVSPDTMAIVAGNLLGILVIVAYEHTHVVVSKSLPLLLKTR